MLDVTMIVFVEPAIGFFSLIQTATGANAIGQLAQLLTGGALGTQAGLWMRSALLWHRRVT